MRPQSEKTLNKLYAELGLPKEKTDLLHDYFLCFANLYGVIDVREAWKVFLHYEGAGVVRKKDFVAFSGIAQREPGHPYSILELREVYRAETSVDPLDRLIVNNRLILPGHGKYTLIYNTMHHQCGKSFYKPDEKREFLSHVEDRFFLSPEGEIMVRFLGRLKTNGKRKGFDGKVLGAILDIDGKPVAGKCLRDFVFYTWDEQLEIDYARSETTKERFRSMFRKTALDKLLDLIIIELQTGGYVYNSSMLDFLDIFLDQLDEDFGVSLSDARFETFTALFWNLNNRSHLWLNCGWRPEDLFRSAGGGLPKYFSVGPNLKKEFESGQMDRDEFERQLAALGIKLLD